MTKVLKSDMSIKDAIQKLSKPARNIVPNFIGRVISVDKGEFIAKIIDEDSELIHEVDLQAAKADNHSSFIVFPKVNSYVLCTRVETSEDFVLSPLTYVDEMWLGGNEYGTIKAEILQKELNKTNALLQCIVGVLKQWTPPPAPDNGVAATLMFTALLANITGQQIGDFKEIINDKVKHGKKP